MNTRLKQFLAAENITQSQFADTINVVRASVSHVLSGRNNPGYDFIKAIMTTYPALSMEWLILGRGKMYRDSPTDAVTAPPEPDFPPIYHEPDLFENLDKQDENIPVVEVVPTVSQTTVSQTTVPSPVVKQRKVVKVTIFFDDGTYQEM
jgi:transcriptional regulator with XRE-family HTH domain